MTGSERAQGDGCREVRDHLVSEQWITDCLGHLHWRETAGQHMFKQGPFGLFVARVRGRLGRQISAGQN